MQFDLEKIKTEIDEVYYLTNFYLDKSWLVRQAVLLDRTRRRIKTFLVNFGYYFKKKPKLSKNVINILVRCEAGIGDCLMVLPLIVSLKRQFPNSAIYFSYDSKAVYDMIFAKNDLISAFVSPKSRMSSYDLVLAGRDFFSIIYYNKKRIEAFAPNFMKNIEEGLKIQKRLSVFTEFGGIASRFVSQLAIKNGSNRIKTTGVICGIDVDPDEKIPLGYSDEKADLPCGHDFNNMKYITIHKGLDANAKLKGRNPSKCWPDGSWEEFVKLFKIEFPEIKVVQLGGRNSPEYPFTDICLVNKTGLGDLPYILKGGLLHIDGESGLVHINKFLGKTSLVLFGPTDERFYGYKNNINITAKKCGRCMFIDKHWSIGCPLNKDISGGDCMSSISPQIVFEATKAYLKNNIITESPDNREILQTDTDEMINIEMGTLLYFHSQKSKLVKKAINRFRKRNPEIYPDVKSFTIFQNFNK